jgi:hypothetical protein
MHKLVFALTGATALCATSTAYGQTINFTSPAGNVYSSTHQYGATGNPSLYVIATGYDTGGNKTNLYGKNLGGDEVGLGLNADPSGQHEIFRGAFVQLNVSDLFGQVSSAMFHFGSDTLNEQWEVYGSNTDGSLGTALLYGINDEANHNLMNLGGLGWGNYNYYNFRSLGTGIHGLDGSSTGNVLLGNLVVTAAVPEPSTWAMMLLGFGAIGFAARRNRKTALVTQSA